MKYLLMTILVINLLGLRSSYADQTCYSLSQGICTAALSNLWIAYTEKQRGSICRYFHELHTCTMDYATKCRFSEYDKNLYREDIVFTFTREPYSCDIIGGNMESKYDKSKATSLGHTSRAICCVTLVLTIIYSMIMNLMYQISCKLSLY